MQRKIDKLKKHTLLFVDDEENIQITLANIFKNLEANFFIAKDAKDALIIIKENSNIDFVITDINMPNINGFELIREIQNQNEKIKFLVLSAHSETSYIKKANDLNIKNYLVKPLDIIKLINAIVE